MLPAQTLSPSSSQEGSWRVHRGAGPPVSGSDPYHTGLSSEAGLAGEAGSVTPLTAEGQWEEEGQEETDATLLVTSSTSRTFFSPVHHRFFSAMNMTSKLNTMVKKYKST